MSLQQKRGVNGVIELLHTASTKENMWWKYEIQPWLDQPENVVILQDYNNALPGIKFTKDHLTSEVLRVCAFKCKHEDAINANDFVKIKKNQEALQKHLAKASAAAYVGFGAGY